MRSLLLYLATLFICRLYLAAANEDEPLWKVKSGDCYELLDCIVSPRYPAPYGDNTNTCEVEVLFDGRLDVKFFHTEQGDNLLIHDEEYSGGGKGPHMVAVYKGDTISWVPDNQWEKNFYGGFKFCRYTQTVAKWCRTLTDAECQATSYCRLNTNAKCVSTGPNTPAPTNPTFEPTVSPIRNVPTPFPTSAWCGRYRHERKCLNKGKDWCYWNSFRQDCMNVVWSSRCMNLPKRDCKTEKTWCSWSGKRQECRDRDDIPDAGDDCSIRGAFNGQFKGHVATEFKRIANTCQCRNKCDEGDWVAFTWIPATRKCRCYSSTQFQTGDSSSPRRSGYCS